MKSALITGGAKRLGKAVSEVLFENGYKVGIHYNQSKAQAEELVGQIIDARGKARAFHADFSDFNSLEQMAEEVEDFLGCPDLLVNNADYFSNEETLSSSSNLFTEEISEVELALKVGALSHYYLFQKFGLKMKSRGSGKVISILDNSIDKPFFSRPGHTLAKRALLSISEMAREELLPEVEVLDLKLGYVLPPDNMPKEESEKVSWDGVEDFKKSFEILL